LKTIKTAVTSNLWLQNGFFLHCIDLLRTYKTKPATQYMPLLIKYLVQMF